MALGTPHSRDVTPNDVVAKVPRVPHRADGRVAYGDVQIRSAHRAGLDALVQREEGRADVPMVGFDDPQMVGNVRDYDHDASLEGNEYQHNCEPQRPSRIRIDIEGFGSKAIGNEQGVR